MSTMVDGESLVAVSMKMGLEKEATVEAFTVGFGVIFVNGFSDLYKTEILCLELIFGHQSVACRRV